LVPSYINVTAGNYLQNYTKTGLNDIFYNNKSFRKCKRSDFERVNWGAYFDATESLAVFEELCPENWSGLYGTSSITGINT